MSKLKNKLKYPRIVSSVFFAILLLTGCGAGDENNVSFDIYATTEAISQSNISTGYPVAKPSQIEYLIPNAIVENAREMYPSVNPPREIVGQNNYIYYPFFTGLKDNEVTDKVNAHVQSLLFEVDDMLNPKTIAPFRGIKTLIHDNTVRSSSSISLYTSFNANNILSLRGYGSGTYDTEVGGVKEESWVNISKGLNLDLNTGENIPLKALFVDGYDYERVINSDIMAQINQNNLTDEDYLEYIFMPTRLAKPFNGIKSDQAYCLDAFNLSIIFDVEDERFDTKFEQVLFTVPLDKFGDNLAINTRYLDPENNLYTDETERRLLPNWKIQEIGQPKSLEGSFEGGKWYLMAYSQSGLLEDIYDALIEESRIYLSTLKMAGKDNYAEISLCKNTIGRYISFSKYSWTSQGDTGISDTEFMLYDTSGNEILLEDLFVKDFDFETILKEEVRKSILKDNYYSDSEIDDAYAAKRFTIDQSNIVVQVALPDHGEGIYPQQIYIPFEAIGVRNMTIFD